MEQPWRVVAAFGVMAVLAAGIAWFGLRGESDSQTLPDSTTVATVAATVVAPTTLPPRRAADLSPVGSFDQDVLGATTGALAAWGEFAVTGDLAVAVGWFVAGGPQLAQLRTEAPELLAAPLGPPAYRFELLDPTVVTSAGGDDAVVTSEVVMTRAGEPDQQFDWHIHLHRIDGAWQLWTVDTVE